MTEIFCLLIFTFIEMVKSFVLFVYGLIATASAGICTQAQFDAINAALETEFSKLYSGSRSRVEIYNEFATAINAAQYPCEPCLRGYVTSDTPYVSSDACNANFAGCMAFVFTIQRDFKICSLVTGTFSHATPDTTPIVVNAAQICTETELSDMKGDYETAAAAVTDSKLTPTQRYETIAAGMTATRFPCEPCLRTYIIDGAEHAASAECVANSKACLTYKFENERDFNMCALLTGQFVHTTVSGTEGFGYVTAAMMALAIFIL